MQPKQLEELEWGSPGNCSKTLNLSDISSDRGINSPPVFPINNPHTITNESITILEDSPLEEIKGVHYKVQEGNVVFQSQVRDSQIFKQIFDELRGSEDIRIECKEERVIVCHPVISIEKPNNATLQAVSLPIFSKEFPVSLRTTISIMTDPTSTQSAETQIEVYKASYPTQTENHDVKIIEQMKAKLEVQCKSIGNYQREKRKLSKKIADLQSSLNTFKAESQKMQESLKTENASMKKELEKSQELSTLLNIEVCEERMKSLNLTSTVKSLSSEVEKLKKEANKVQEQDKTIANLNEKAKELSEEISKLRGSAGEYENEIKKLKTQIEKMEEETRIYKEQSEKQEHELKDLEEANKLIENEAEKMKADADKRVEEFNELLKARDESILTLKIEVENATNRQPIPEQKCVEIQTSPTQPLIPEAKVKRDFSGELKSQFEQLLSQRVQNCKTSCADYSCRASVGPDRELIKDRIKVLKTRQEMLLSKTSRVYDRVGRNSMNVHCASACADNVENVNPWQNSSNLWTNGKLTQKVVACQKSGKTRVLSINQWNPSPCEHNKGRTCMTHRGATPEMGELETPSSDEKENIPFRANMQKLGEKKLMRKDRFLTQRYSHA